MGAGAQRLLMVLFTLSAIGTAALTVAMLNGEEVTARAFWEILASTVGLWLSLCPASASRNYLAHKIHEKQAEIHAEEYRQN